MAKRGKNKNRPPKIDFEIEEDADQIFRDYVENMGDIPEHERSIPEPKPIPSSKSKGAKRSSAADAKSIDLHGMTLKEAVQSVDRFLASIIFDLRGETTVKIITGKGRHSGPDGAVLPGGVHKHVNNTWRRHIVRIDESPEDVAIAGLPIRGHFEVRLKK
jgi:DNA-nicking Smr family endonuclease